jgi:hypothetical protein
MMFAAAAAAAAASATAIHSHSRPQLSYGHPVCKTREKQSKRRKNPKNPDRFSRINLDRAAKRRPFRERVVRHRSDHR